MSYREVAAHRPLRRYLTAQVFSSFGDSALWLCCGIWVHQLTGSNAAAGLTFFFFLLPALLAPFAGLAADRLPRRNLLACLNAAGAVVVMPLLLVRTESQVWLIYTVMAANGALSVCIGPAQSSLLADLAPAHLLGSMNGLLRTGQECLRLIAPVAGAGLFVSLGPKAVVLLDAATFALAALVICLLPKPPKAESRQPLGPITRELMSGVSILFSDRILARVVLASAIFMAVAGFGESARWAVVTEGLDAEPATIGVLQLVMGAGAVLFGLASGPFIARAGANRVFTSSLAAFGVGSLLTATSTGATIYAGAMLVGGGGAALVVSALTLLQKMSRPEFQGRAFSGFELLTTVPQVLSVGFGAALIAAIDYRAVLVMIALGCFIACLIAMRANETMAREDIREATQ